MIKICAHCQKTFEAITEKSKRWRCCSPECGMARRIEGTRNRWAKDVPWERFMSHVIPVTESGCWLWETDNDVDGMSYGQFHVNNEKIGAHRWVYEQVRGAIPEGLHLDHLCRIPCCVNPYHTEPVTCKVNVLRGVSPFANNARKITCVNGHAFDGSNVFLDREGYRGCRRCRINSLRWSRFIRLVRGMARYIRQTEGAAGVKTYLGQLALEFESEVSV
jgi:hypothetical protein